MIREDENLRIKRFVDLDKSSLPPDGGRDFNRLIFSNSPYLLQHADNPVEWYPWGEEAFAKAIEEQKPVFLSIGYSTCHWCHVMAHESFEDPEVAEVFNRSYVCIKVDREERPDIDEQYMAVAQMMTGSGGWPLNIFMAPDKRPFWAATYIPRTQHGGMPGIIQVLEYFARLWRDDRSRLLDNAAAAVASLERYYRPVPGATDVTLVDEAYQQLSGIYDDRSGGFGNAPKFPMPLSLGFLLNYGKRRRDRQPLAMVEHTLQMMRRGGIYDQIGFGFHRYSVDSRWLVPHFEKMLYDQALISQVYLATFQATSHPFYLQVAEEIFSHAMEEMTSPDGAFYSGLDADTEGEEGRFYLWHPSEIAAALGDEGAALFCRMFDVTEKGNYEGENILNLPVEPHEFCHAEGIDPGLCSATIDRWRRSLLEVRKGRIRPFRDEKVITGWNGLMIAALAKGYAVTGSVQYLEAARRAMEFILGSMTDASSRLMRSFHLGTTSESGFLEDYACITAALIELHQVTLDDGYLEKARFLSDEMLRLFGGHDGALFETGSDAETLLVRHINVHDGVVPSGNSMAAFDLLRLGRITGDASFSDRGAAIVRSFMETVAKQPANSVLLLSAADYSVSPEVIVTLSGEKDALQTMLCAVHRRFVPDMVVRYGGTGQGGEYPAIDGLPTAYVCAKGACLPPVTGIEALGPLLDNVH